MLSFRDLYFTNISLRDVHDSFLEYKSKEIHGNRSNRIVQEKKAQSSSIEGKYQFNNLKVLSHLQQG